MQILCQPCESDDYGGAPLRAVVSPNVRSFCAGLGLSCWTFFFSIAVARKETPECWASG